MPDWAVTTSVSARDGMSGPFGVMSTSVHKFGSAAGLAFAGAERGASRFATFLKAHVFGNLITGAIRGIVREIRQLPQMMTDFTDRADLISKQSRSIGLTADSFQRLQYAAGLSNVSTDLLQGSFEKLNNQMGQLQAGTGTLNSIVGKLNPGLARQLRTVNSTEQAFMLTAEAIALTEDVQTRAAIAQAAFGRAGQDMLPLLLEGRSGIQKLMVEASKYGNILTDKTVVAAELFNDTLTRFQSGVTAVKETVLTSLMFAIQPYVSKLAEWIAANKDLIATKIQDWVQKVVDVVTRMGQWYTDHKAEIAAVWGGIVTAIKWIGEHAGLVLGIAVAWKAVTIALGVARTAQIAFNLAAAASGAAGAAGAVAPAVGGLGPAAQALMGGGAAVAGGASMAALTAIPVVGAALALAPSVLSTVVNPQAQIDRAKNLNAGGQGRGGIGGLLDRAQALGMRLAGVKPEAPNAAAAANQANVQRALVAMQNNVAFTVDNTAAPGVTTRIRPAPRATAPAGAQYAGAR